MVMTGRAMTGQEAVSANLATGLVWSASAYEELIALMRQMLDNTAQVRYPAWREVGFGAMCGGKVTFPWRS